MNGVYGGERLDGSYRPRLKGEARGAVARRLAALYEAGSTIRNIAAANELSYGTVRVLLLEQNVKLRPRGGRRPRPS